VILLFPVEDPVLAFFAISITALVYTAASNIIMQRIGDRKRLKWIQDEVNRINKIVLEAAKSDDEKKKKEADELQAKLPDLLKESMVLQFKPLLISLPLFIIVSWGLRQLFPSFEIKLAFAIPVVVQNLERFPNWRDTFGVFGWFILTILFGGILMQFVVSTLEKSGKKP
jgi:uncharacterized membrane protein (DUF106 family)